MLDLTNCNILDLIAHQVGNQTNDEELILSASLLNTEDSHLRELLVKYFLYPFENMQEFYSFTFSDEDFTLNPLYQYATSIFSEKDNFKMKSESIAKHLYKIALHPKIKSGDLFVVTLENISLDGEMVNALGFLN